MVSAYVIINAATCQSYHWCHCPPKIPPMLSPAGELSSMPLLPKAITDIFPCQSKHRCHCPPKKPSTPPSTKTIITDLRSCPHQVNKEKERERKQENRPCDGVSINSNDGKIIADKLTIYISNWTQNSNKNSKQTKSNQTVSNYLWDNRSQERGM